MEYDITICEMLKKTVTVEADTREAAEHRVEEDWKAGNYVLDSDDFKEVDFFTERERPSELIDVLIVEPGVPARQAAISNKLKPMQEIVGGYIEVVYPYDDPVAIVCNEEGKMIGMPLCRALVGENGEVMDILAGTFIVCGSKEDEFSSLSQEQIDKYTQMFKDPKSFMRVNGELVVLKDNARSNNISTRDDIGSER